jgi:hypothetical protein
MRKALIRPVILLSLIGFSLGLLAMSFHHHNNKFLLPACSICKVKASLSGTFNKIKLDTSAGMAMLCLLLTEINLCLSGFLPAEKTVRLVSQAFGTYPNKAPPFTF